jgi:hypothetical protein
MIVVSEALRQVQTGKDFDGFADVLSELTPEQATTAPGGAPYSIATLVFHSWFWLDRWLKQLSNIHCEPFGQDDSDFPVVNPDQWNSVREQFLAVFADLQERALEPSGFEVITQFGDTAEVLLLRAALHTSYHVGQIVLLRTMIGLSPA